MICRGVYNECPIKCISKIAITVWLELRIANAAGHASCTCLL